MKKLTWNVQSLISASNQINTISRAVEELVYNSLDAGATSVAIRIDIQENIIQVIDNGCGVSSIDYKSIGLKYMTSKFIDLSTLKSAPNKYGFRGQALSNIINVSKSVKVISRHENSEETWMKLFEYGIEKLINKWTTRPCQGTTIEITGLLYNRSIQRKSINMLAELQSIQTFLEQLSLIHCNISLSLRDDSKNEIIFKIHKNRDIYQTLSTLYNIDKNNIQELQVEKSEYKVTAYMAKSDEAGIHFIFLNGKSILNTSKLYKIVNNNLSKHFEVKGIQKLKTKDMNTEEESNLIQKKIPDYFIFIKCPYMDYDLSNSPKQSVLEFKDWNQINKLLDKLIKLFNGDINLEEGNRVDEIQACNKAEYSDTREQVKKIMENILGTHSKKPGIHQMHNAIKGKQAKRKSKNLPLKPVAEGSYHKETGNDNSKPTNNMVNINKCNNSQTKESNRNEKPVAKKKTKHVTKPCLGTNIGKRYDFQFKKMNKNYESNIPQRQGIDKIISKKRKSDFNKDAILRKFENKTVSFAKRCDELERRTRDIIDQMHKKAYHMFVNENIVMKNNSPNRHINISVRKQINEIIIHNNALNRPKSKLANEHNANENVKNKLVQSNYDLLQTILKSQQVNNDPMINFASKLNNTTAIIRPPRFAIVTGIDDVNKSINNKQENNFTEPMVTFTSHNYYTHRRYNTEDISFHSHEHIQNENQHSTHNKPRMFITKQSKDNFVIPSDVFKRNNFKKKNLKTRFSKQFQSHIKSIFKQTSKLFDLKKQIIGNTCESSFTIEFSKSNSCRLTNNKDVIVTDKSRNTRMSIEEILPHSDNHVSGSNDNIYVNTDTYVAPNVYNYGYTINDDDNWAFHGTYTIEKPNEVINNTELPKLDHGINDNIVNRNFIFVSKSQEHNQNEEIIDPIHVCETILGSEEMLDEEFGLSFNRNQNLSDKLIYRKYDDTLYGCFNSKENKKVSEHIQKKHDLHNRKEVSHHFSSHNSVRNKVTKVNKTMNSSPILTSRQSINLGKQPIQEENISKFVNESNINDFNFVNRLYFLPKGLSPIFQNCQTKNVCEYNLSRDYYEKEMYKNFADDIRNNAKIFEPNIQNVKDITTKADKANAKRIKDNSVLKFDGESLKNAKILGQIDEKFIAAIMKEGCNEAPRDYIVLFDQHAVHERIKLENNLTDYFNENRWKPVKIDAVSLMLSKDDVLYLHNFKGKFEHLGLQWTVTSANEVSISAIPEAILGKNPRQVERVMKAVKDLIDEEIRIMKIQGGCISLYPKSIMDLVFNEACRYAVKFGDKLSISECVELLKALSSCKTPFQCAHGRPVLAIIMEIKLNRADYKINLDKIMKWKRKL